MTVELLDFSLLLSESLETARGAIETREGFLVAIEKGNGANEGDRGSGREGAIGIGEATPLPGWTESPGECEAALRRAAETYETSGDPQRAIETLSAGETPAARHGFEAAWLDHRARAADEPLYRHLGGARPIERVAVNATIGDATPAESARAASDATEAGFRCLKVKVGARGVEHDIARLKAVHEAAPNAGIRVDANGAWSYAEAAGAIDAFERATGTGLAYVEQPLSATDLAGHAALREERSTEIALDETVCEHGVDAVLDAGAADVVICKPMVLGGLDRTRAVARRARSAGVSPVVTTTIDGAVARAGAVHLAASLAPIAPCGLATASLLDEDLVGRNPAPIAEGFVQVPQSPGTIEKASAREAIETARDRNGDP